MRGLKANSAVASTSIRKKTPENAVRSVQRGESGSGRAVVGHECGPDEPLIRNLRRYDEDYDEVVIEDDEFFDADHVE